MATIGNSTICLEKEEKMPTNYSDGEKVRAAGLSWLDLKNKPLADRLFFVLFKHVFRN
ncbi:hypothetical protein C5S31_05985 [ANME-1 cluster archaeon GoMg2]|nr:hypothetical protein [ANME-1 cluster archaeon GoMg2]